MAEEISDLHKLKQHLDRMERLVRGGGVDNLISARVIVLMGKMIVKICEDSGIK